MQEYLHHFRKGYLRIQIRNGEPERFFTLCARRGIELWNLIHTPEGYSCCISVPGFLLLQPICRKTGARIHILEKHGLPFFLLRNRKKKAFFVGICLCMLLLWQLCSFIWDIRLEGNYAYSNQKLLEYLNTIEIHPGCRKKEINCSRIAADIRKEFPDILWVSARLEGTCLNIEIKENTDSYRNEEVPSESPADLIADCDGTVVSIVTRTGTPLVKAGVPVKKGDILVSGVLEIQDDNGEVLRHDYVRADADVILETTYSYYDEFEKKHAVRVYDPKTSRYPALRIFSWQLEFGKSRSLNGNDKYQNMKQLYLTENFALPIYLGSIEVKPYQVVEKLYTEDEMKTLSEKRLIQCTEKLKKKGVQIYKKNVKITLSDTACITKGELVVRTEACTFADVRTEPETSERITESE